jgi:hypothetical protein
MLVGLDEFLGDIDREFTSLGTLGRDLFAWTAPMPLGVVAGPVPTSVPAGLGQPAALSDTGRRAWLSAAGLLALAGVAALRRAPVSECEVSPIA